MSQHTDKGISGEHKTAVEIVLQIRRKNNSTVMYKGKWVLVCVCVSVCGVNALIMLISQFHSIAWWFPVGKTACHVPPNSREWVWKRKNWNTLIFSLCCFLTLYDQQQLFPASVTLCVAHFHVVQTVIHLFRLIRLWWCFLRVQSASPRLRLKSASFHWLQKPETCNPWNLS